jgi:hypothetical protein
VDDSTLHLVLRLRGGGGAAFAININTGDKVPINLDPMLKIYNVREEIAKREKV